MARASSAGKSRSGRKARVNPVGFVVRWGLRAVVLLLLAAFALVLLWSKVNPPATWYMMAEARRLGGVEQDWAAMEDIAPVMARSAVAAEDANFCLHWGFDVTAIRAAIEDGGERGASTISQQVVKNVYLWHGRNWTRKAMEAALTPLVEAIWSKKRILEVYLNVAEFGEGVFGIDAAARHHFGVEPKDLSDIQAARLAAILPSPRTRSPSNPSDFVRKRTAQIRDGAATILRDGRAACFED